MLALRGRKKWIALAALALSAVVGVSVAVAAVTSSVVVADTNTVREKIVQTEVSGGFESGWHIHPGPAIVQVQDGQIMIFQNSCHPRILNAGDTYIEIPGVPVDAVVKDSARWTTTFILPNSAPGQPDRVAASDPCS
jgi:quercetin dioxygenase-like cupin family protein